MLETAEMLQKLSGELAECAYEIASLLPDKRGQEEHQITVERGEILRRDWAAKVRTNCNCIYHILITIDASFDCIY